MPTTSGTTTTTTTTSTSNTTTTTTTSATTPTPTPTPTPTSISAVQEARCLTSLRTSFAIAELQSRLRISRDPEQATISGSDLKEIGPLMWFLILSLSACVTGWDQITPRTFGFRITTKSICQARQSTRESYSADPDRDSNSTLRWGKPCWLPLDLLEGILSTSAGFPNGIWSGLTLRTQGDRSRQRVSRDFHRKKINCTSGVTCIFHVGCPTSGHAAALSGRSHLTLTAWTRPRSLRPLPYTICQGKTGRRWRLRSTDTSHESQKAQTSQQVQACTVCLCLT